MFQVLELISHKGPHARANEDAVGATGGAGWVIDGATGISDGPALTPGPTDPAWLARWLHEALCHALVGGDQIPLAGC